MRRDEGVSEGRREMLGNLLKSRTHTFEAQEFHFILDFPFSRKKIFRSIVYHYLISNGVCKSFRITCFLANFFHTDFFQLFP